MRFEQKPPKKPEQFKPIEIKFVVETQEEYETLKAMTLYNVSIPDLIKSSTNHPGQKAARAKIAFAFLMDLKDALTK